MARLQSSGFFDLGDGRLEFHFVGRQPEVAPTLVLLHEGLGSAMQWGALPETLARTTECGVLAVSRRGYGASSAVPLPRPADYLEHEARAVLPRILDAADVRSGVLIGHSDGASIAALALAQGDVRLRGGVLIAPHFFVEEVTLSAIRQTRAAYERGLLRTRLGRWHADVEGAFRGWNDAWLDPGRRGWTIEAALTHLTVPVTLIQGTEDAYGTQAQIAAARRSCPPGLLTVRKIPHVGHEPHREAFADTVAFISAFVRHVLKDAGGQGAAQA
ncbi:alpha/beta fold hydrolase [Methylobacterium fujisawaense]|uniref:alpha/beta fold hydrolase n=1 Tax=Methylobacterium fujisawaense TaxID=107400 RepID=UPI0036FBD55E